MKARVTRFPIRADGSLGAREQYGPDLGMEFAPDGVAFDEAGNLWVVCPGAHALGVITPAGAWEIAVRDPAVCSTCRPTSASAGATGAGRTSGTSPAPRSPPSVCRTRDGARPPALSARVAASAAHP